MAERRGVSERTWPAIGRGRRKPDRRDASHPDGGAPADVVQRGVSSRMAPSRTRRAFVDPLPCPDGEGTGMVVAPAGDRIPIRCSTPRPARRPVPSVPSPRPFHEISLCRRRVALPNGFLDRLAIRWRKTLQPLVQQAPASDSIGMRFGFSLGRQYALQTRRAYGASPAPPGEVSPGTSGSNDREHGPNGLPGHPSGLVRRALQGSDR